MIAMTRFTDRITKPLRDLTKAAKQVDEGNYDFTLKYDKDDEIGILTRHSNSLQPIQKRRSLKWRNWIGRKSGSTIS